MKFDPIEFVLANATKTLHCFVLFSLLNCSSFWAQDCANDTIPPKIECIADYKICPGLCGNEEVYASEFVTSATDNCSKVIISFDPEGKIWTKPLYEFYLSNELHIYARDSAGNVSLCATTFEVLDSHIPTVECNVISHTDYRVDGSFELVGMIDGGIEYPFYKRSYGQNGYTIQKQNCAPLTTLKVRPKNFEQFSMYLSAIDKFTTVKYIIGKLTSISPFNFYSLDADCNKELNVVDFLHINHYQYGDSSKIIGSCVGKDFALFLDENYEILGDEKAAQSKSSYSENIALGIHGDFNRNMVSYNSKPIKNPISIPQNTAIELSLQDFNCEAGKNYEMEIDLSKIQDLEGMQFNLKYSPDKISMDTNHLLGQRASYDYKNDVRMVFNQDRNGANEISEPTSIKFTALDNFKLSEAFDLSVKTISNIAVLNDGTQHPINVVFQTSTSNNDIENDVNIICASSYGVSVIKAELGTNKNYNLEVVNLFGQVVHHEKGISNEGRIDKEIFGLQRGVYTCKIALSDGISLVKKFVQM
jgi:hypothetical protein